MFHYNTIVMKTNDDASMGDNQSKQFLIELFRPIIADIVADVLNSLPKPEPLDPKPLTVQDVADLTSNSIHWVYKYSDVIPGKMRLGKRIYWDRSQVLEWMREHKEEV